MTLQEHHLEHVVPHAGTWIEISETTAHVNFDYTACDDISRVYIYVFNDAGEIVKHFTLCQFYDFESESQNYEDAKKCLLELLIDGRCPLNES